MLNVFTKKELLSGAADSVKISNTIEKSQAKTKRKRVAVRSSRLCKN
jgi:hypothetical protein